MRKFWIVLLSIGLIMAFTMPVLAADVKVSGSYYVTGYYEDNFSLKKNTSGNNPQAFVQQRLRLQPEFKIAEGLTLVTRFDAVEKKWGDQTWAAGSAYDNTNRSSTGNSASRVQENIEWERAYVDFTTGIGRFMVGYQNFIAWGTDFLDTHATRPGIKYIYSTGPLTFVAAWEQVVEGNAGLGSTVNGQPNDSDYSIYDLGASYKAKAVEAGLLVQFARNATGRTSGSGSYMRELYVLDPYVKATFGKFYVEAEGGYIFGKWNRYEQTGNTDKDVSAYAFYLGAKGDFGPAYAGLKFAIVSGDDPTTSNTIEGNIAEAMVAGQVFSPCLILWNDPRSTWVSKLAGYVTTSAASGTSNQLFAFVDNAWLYYVYGGFKPTPKLDVMAAVTYAYADKKPQTGWYSDVYGTELDVTATYKIYDNLSYMVGIGYLWTGDYFKGTSASNTLDNDYQILHKLTLSF